MSTARARNYAGLSADERRLARRERLIEGAIRAYGELGYRNPANNAYSEAVYGGNAKIAAVNCTTCHSVTNDTDPHKTGLPYAPGSFPLRVPTGTNDPSFIEKSADTSAVSGTAAGNLGTSNTCAWCHRSRKDVTNYITASVTLTTSEPERSSSPATATLSVATTVSEAVTPKSRLVRTASVTTTTSEPETSRSKLVDTESDVVIVSEPERA